MKTQKLIVIATIVCLFLGVGIMAQADTEVDIEGDTLTAIRGLELGFFVYDVAFPRQTGKRTYDAFPRFPTTFDFESQEEAEDAVEAVISILEDQDLSKVGAPGSAGSPRFSVGFREKAVRIGDSRINFQMVIVRQGIYDKEWTEWTSEFDVWYLYRSTITWADFTVVGFTGDLDLPPLVRRGRR